VRIHIDFIDLDVAIPFASEFKLEKAGFDFLERALERKGVLSGTIGELKF